MGSHFLLQGIFPIQGSNLHLLHCRRLFFFFFLPLSHLESPLVSIGEIQFCLSPFSENDRHSHPKKLLTNLLHLHLHPLPLFSSSCALLLFQKNNYISGNMCVKHLPASPGDLGSSLGSGRSPGEGKGNPLQCSCLGNPMNREAWLATVHGVAKESDTT